MAPLTRMILAAVVAVSVTAASAVLDLIPANFDEIVLESNKPALVEFFAPWCGHCKTLAPIYEELAHQFDFAKDKVSIAKIDADAEKSLGQRFGVQGFPTLKWFDGKSDKPEDYEGGRDLDSLTDFIRKKTGIKPKRKAIIPSTVLMLTDESFKAEVGGEKHILVAITAPWCGHCKKLAPTWETIAKDFASEPSVLIAKIDAEAENAKASAKELGVTSYPTIKYFPAGSTEPSDYEGSRNEADLVEFMNTKAGTNRMVGGGLNAKAGTIATLDAILEKVTMGTTTVSISEEIAKAATSIKSKYAEYYIKASAKLDKNQAYVDNELGRLEGLIKKGGLATEKLDDLVSRSNILRKFKSGGSHEKEEL